MWTVGAKKWKQIRGHQHWNGRLVSGSQCEGPIPRIYELWLPPPPDVATSESNSLLNPIYTDLWRKRQCSSESKIVSPNTKRRRRDQERRLSNPYRRSSGPACGCAGLQRRGRRRSPVRNSGRSSRRRGKRKRNLRLEVNNNGPELGSMRGPVVKWWAVKLSNLEPCWPREKILFFLRKRWKFFAIQDTRNYAYIRIKIGRDDGLSVAQLARFFIVELIYPDSSNRLDSVAGTS